VFVNLALLASKLTRLHAPRTDVREMASNDNSEEYLPVGKLMFYPITKIAVVRNQGFE
jgi:hypothetical protein